MSRKKKWPPEVCLKKLQEIKANGGRINCKSLKERKDYSSLYDMLLYHFDGGWAGAVRQAGFDPDKERESNDSTPFWNQDLIIKRIREIKARGEPIYQGYLDTHYRDLAMAIMHHFEGKRKWVQALRKAGFDPEMETAWWTVKKVVRKLCELKWRGIPLNHRYLHDNFHPLCYHMTVFLGSWENAIQFAGLDPRQEALRGKQECEKLIGNLWSFKSSGEPINPSSLLENHPGIYQGLKNHFGSWERGVECAGFNPDKERIGRVTRKKVSL